ncbi:MAG: signal recognition particle-docking protein FtsY [Gallionellaceae bacterium]|jgi:fused signal recognition particle receptor|nr:signal recognition particle-docking protein FtsY [Gallionellaceae bacterium]
MFSFLKKNSPEPSDAKPGSGWVARLKSSLTRTGSQLTDLFTRGGKIDDDLYEELETILITADVGMDATSALLADLRHRVKEQRLTEAVQLKEALAQCLLKLLKPLAQPLQADAHKPFVIMLCGVNGAGKTTSIGKLAKHLQSQGLSVLLAAGDTFRAAAREQLMTWGERNNVTVIAQQSGDAAAVIYDAVQAAQARNIDVVLADTAGRLTTQAHLMEEIKKVKRVIAKAMPPTSTSPGAPHEVLLVLDANTGQNALSQVKAFDEALGVTGLILTKLDGTAKGGVIAAIAHSHHHRAHPIPVRFIGVGEGLDDLRPFVAEDFVAALLGLDEQ